MRGFLKFVKKETLHILRDSRTMLIALLMPVVQILLFGFAISTEVNNVNVAVVVPGQGGCHCGVCPRFRPSHDPVEAKWQW